MLVIVFLGVMWARWPCWNWTHQVQCESGMNACSKLEPDSKVKRYTVLSVIFRPLEECLAEAGGHLASNPSLTLFFYPAKMPDGPAKKPGAVRTNDLCWLLPCDQLRIHLLHSKYFWLLLRRRNYVICRYISKISMFFTFLFSFFILFVFDVFIDDISIHLDETYI